MPLKNYSVLIGQVVDRKAETDQDTPHYQIHVRAAGVDHRVAVNVQSAQEPADLLFFADDTFAHPVLPALQALPDGRTTVASAPGGAALDYVRGNLVDCADMRTLPATAPGQDNDLSERLDHFVGRALADPAARIYVLGEAWGPETEIPDKIFGFSPGNGIHDVHMNQGNAGRFARDNGVWQDGGLLLHFPDPEQWVAVFLAFQSQDWHTDEVTGNPLSVDGAEIRDGRVRIVGALVNALGPAPEAESVTVLNTSPEPQRLQGWTLLDRAEHVVTIGPVELAPGSTERIGVAAPFALGNGGGLITLLDDAGLKVDGVSYTGDDAGREGWTVTF